MKEHTLNRVAFRMRERDERNLLTIAQGLQERGVIFATKTEALSTALEFAAGRLPELLGVGAGR